VKVARLALVAVLFSTLLACTPEAEREAESRRQIQAMLEEYLPALADAYRHGDALLLREWVAEKEVARVHKRIEELAEEGRRLEPSLRSVTVEKAEVWGHANALVTTVEVWDLQSVTLGSDVVVQQVDNQTNRVRYQLKRDEGRWRVLFRTIAE